MDWYIIALIAYISPGLLVACACAVHAMVRQESVRLLGMFRMVILWPLVLIAAVIYAARTP